MEILIIVSCWEESVAPTHRIPMEEHTSQNIWAVQTSLEGLKIKGHKIRYVGEGEDLGKVKEEE